MVKLVEVYFLLVEHMLSGESWNTVLQQKYSFNGRNCSSIKDVGGFTAKWSQCGLQSLHYSQELIIWLEEGLVKIYLYISCQLLGGVLLAKISTETVSNQFFLSILLCFSCRTCEVGGSLCHMSEGRDKNCQQREAQRVGANEGNFLMGDF